MSHALARLAAVVAVAVAAAFNRMGAYPDDGTIAFDYGAAREYLRTDDNGIAVNDDTEFVTAAVQLAGATQAKVAALTSGGRVTLSCEPVLAKFPLLVTRISRVLPVVPGWH